MEAMQDYANAKAREQRAICQEAFDEFYETNDYEPLFAQLNGLRRL